MLAQLTSTLSTGKASNAKFRKELIEKVNQFQVDLLDMPKTGICTIKMFLVQKDTLAYGGQGFIEWKEYKHKQRNGHLPEHAEARTQ